MNFKIFNYNFSVDKKLNSGSFSSIYSIRKIDDDKNDNNNDCLIMKIANSNLNKTVCISSHLHNEYSVYQMLNANQCDGFPKFYYYHQYDNHSLFNKNFIIIQKLYLNLQELFKLCHYKFSLNTIVEIAIQILQRIETLHSFGLIHRDIKPENFMIGFPNNPKEFRTIYMIDFNLCQNLSSSNSNDGIIGSLLFMSCNSHFGLKQMKVDDLESLSYLLLYFLNEKNLPWSNDCDMNENLNTMAKYNPIEHCRKIGSLKQSMTSEQLFEKYPKVFADLYSYSRNLDSKTEPNYEMIQSEFLKYKHGDNGAIFSWESSLLTPQ